MLPTDITSFRELLERFPTEQSCIDWLEFRRWNGKVLSPFVPSTLAWKCKTGNKYICKKTNKYFTVRTKSIFEKTKIPLRDWFMAMWLLSDLKRGMSAKQLAKAVNVTEKTAWFMAHKIRNFYKLETEAEYIPQAIEAKVYELDEACFGGLQANRHADKKIPNAAGGNGIDKTWVLGIVLRTGFLKTFALTARKPEYVQPIIRKYITPGSTLITDAWTGYNGLDDEYTHLVVKDGKKIARNVDPNIHTNRIEGAWGNIKRGFNGTYNWWSKKHLQFYLDEFVFRYNTRKMKSAERFFLFLDNVFSRVTQRDIINRSWT